MSTRMTPKQLEEINLQRAAEMAKTLMAAGGIPVIVCGIQVETKKLITFSFSNAGKEKLKEMLIDHVRDIDQSRLELPGHNS